MSSMHSGFITIFQTMAPLLSDLSDGFVNDGVVLYEFMSVLVDKINGYMLIDTNFVI